MNTGLFTIAATLIAALALSARADEADLACIEDIEVPQMHGTLVGSVPARIEATVLVGKMGKAASVSFRAPTKPLEIEIGFYLKNKTRYSKACEGRSLKIVFSYLVEGDETAELEAVVHFKPPNEFVVISHPVKPIADHTRKH